MEGPVGGDVDRRAETGGRKGGGGSGMTEGRWVDRERHYLGTNKEVFDAEVFAIL